MIIKQRFKDYKFKVENAEESKEVQRLLFILGYTWTFSKTDFVWLSKKWLSTNVVGNIMWHDEGQDEDFYRCEFMTIRKLQELVNEQMSCESIK